ncbi:MAG TPA: hypothetical protein VEJ16_15690 [Alphaproteobacteria bacterium]|nr:hypothetical protein [Alphaproteobacteria bacterium]
MRGIREVKIGQRFMKVAILSQVWEVATLKLGPGGINHCNMRDVRDHTRTILVSEPALRNKRFFKLIQADV